MKKTGHCTFCEKLVFDFTPSLKPLDDAWRVDFLLSDDTLASITFCADCLGVIPENLARIWEICLERFDFEEGQRSGKAPPEVEKFLAHIHEQHLVEEVSRTPWSAEGLLR